MKSRLSRLLVIGILLCSYALQAQDTTFWGGREYRMTKDRSKASSYRIITYIKKGDKGAVAREYFMNHTIKQITPYSDFEKRTKEGCDSIFYESGAIRAVIPFKNGKEDGMLFSYYPNGALKRKGEYQEGKLISGSAYTADGRDTTYTELQINPVFPGGDDSLLRFMRAQTVYPEKARRKGKTGIVITTFLVDEEGNIEKVKIFRSVSKEIDAECIRVVEMMPKWTPGTYDGDLVPVQYFLPFRFSLR